MFPGEAKIIHRGFDDPPRLVAQGKTDGEKMGHYSRVRDEIRQYILSLPESLLR